MDLTFFDASHNGSIFDLGDIPVPIQANISGHSYTEILPLHIGDGLTNISDIASILPLPEHVLNFTEDEDTIFHYQASPVHIHNEEEEHKEQQLADEISQADPLPYVPLYEPQHLDTDDLLQIPLLPTSNVVVDPNSSSSSSSSESSESDEVKKKPALVLNRSRSAS